MVTKEEVLRLAKLSKLSFDEKEIEKFQKDLNEILNHMEQLKELNLENVSPLYNVLEDDVKLEIGTVKETMEKEKFLKNAPKSDENFIILPVIVGDNNE